MQWEAADTYWTIGVVIAVSLAALAVLAIRAAQDERRVCVCDDSDDCTCGGAWGRRKL